MTCSFAAVGPTSDSALPIRAELFGGPKRADGDNISCQRTIRNPKIKDFRGAIGTYGCVTRTRYKREKEAGGKKGRGERTEGGRLKKAAGWTEKDAEGGTEILSPTNKPRVRHLGRKADYRST